MKCPHCEQQIESAMEFGTAEQKAYRRGYIEGSQAGVKIATDVLNRQLPQPIIVGASPPVAGTGK